MNGQDTRTVIRPGTSQDLAAVMRMEQRCFEDPWSPETLFGELQVDDLRTPLIAERDEVICGYLMAWVVVDQLHVLNIATDPDYLRQGVGTVLLKEAIRRALPRGVVEVTLEVRRSNHPARAFYRRHAFADAGVRPGYYQDNGEDAIIMTASCQAVLGD